MLVVPNKNTLSPSPDRLAQTTSLSRLRSGHACIT